MTPALTRRSRYTHQRRTRTQHQTDLKPQLESLEARQLLTTLVGFVYEDINADGVRAGTDPAINGVELQLFLDGGDGDFGTDAQGTNAGTGTVGEDDTYIASSFSSLGNYSFDFSTLGVPNSTERYFVREVVPNGAFATTPEFHELLANPLTDEVRVFDFGNAFEGSVHGRKYEDLNANGQYDVGEPPMENVEIVLFKIENGQRVEVDRMRTDANGEYWFEWLEPGQSYVVDEITPEGTFQTSPEVPPLYLGSGREWVSNQAQADHVLDSVSFPWWWEMRIRPAGQGQAPQDLMFEDMGTLTFGDPVGLSNGNLNQTFDIVNQIGLPNDVPSGTWSIPFSMREFRTTDSQTGVMVEASGQGNLVVVSNGLTLTTAAPSAFPQDSFFDITYRLGFPDPNDPTADPMWVAPNSPLRVPLEFPGPGQHVIDVDDVRWMPSIFWADNNGQAIQPLFDQNGQLWDTLVSWHAIPHVEVEKPIRTRINPLLNVGNAFEGSIHGYKFDDVNGNREWEQGEPTLPGVEIVLTWADASGAPQTTTTTTDEDGAYWFTWLRPGVEYTVSEVPPVGSVQTTPDPDPIFLGSGEAWVATQEQGREAQLTFTFPWWWEVVIDPVDPANGPAIPPQTVMLEGMVEMRTSEFLDPETGARIARLADDNGIGVAPPADTPVRVETEIVAMELGGRMRSGPDSFFDIILSLAPNTSNVGAVQATFDSNVGGLVGDSFFDIWLEMSFQDESGNSMVVGLADIEDPTRPGSLNVGMRFDEFNEQPDVPDIITPNDIRWMPTFFWQTGTARELRDQLPQGVLGDLWDEFVSVHAIPHSEGEKPVRPVVHRPLAFGNHVPSGDVGSIHGYKFHDLNADGIHDDGEPRWPQVEITLNGDVNGDGSPDEIKEFTNANGEYWFEQLHPGVYTITETPPVGSVATTPSSYTVSVIEDIELVALDGQAMLDPDDPNETRVEVNIGPRLAFGNAYEGSIHGYKFNDLNGDGVWDDGEPTLPNIEIALSQVLADGSLAQVDSVVTNDEGEYWFTELEPGETYHVTENAPDGYIQTTLNPPPLYITSGKVWVADTVQIMAGTDPDLAMVEPLLAFGNLLTGSIHGYKFEDINVDGSDNGEPRIPGVVITLTGDSDGDGVTDTLSMPTDQNGEFWFEGLFPGTYKVSETPPWGSFPTTADTFEIIVESGVEYVALDGQAHLEEGDPRTELNVGPDLAFGNAYEGSIHGYKFNDKNGNGIWDNGEQPMPGVEIVLSVAVNGELEPVDRTRTDDTGQFWFEWLEPGLTYQVTENAPAGYIQTTVDPPPLFISSGEEWVADDRQIPHILSTVAFDWWWEIQILPEGSDDPERLMPGGMVALEFAPPVNLDRESQMTTFEFVDLQTGQPTEVPEGGPWLIAFELPETTMDDPETNSSVRIRGQGQMVVARRGDELITLPESDFQVDSFFDIFVELRVPDENGTVMPLQAEESLRIPITFPMPETMPIRPNDVRWMPAIFWAEGLGREFRDVLSDGQLGDVWDKLISIHAVPHGEPDKPIRIMTESQLAFGNLLSGSIHGYKFEDVNANGIDDGEPRLSGVEITLAGDIDGDGDSDDTLTMPTDGNGEYWFEGLRPGTYTVTETPPWGSFPTTPSSYTVVVSSGQELVALPGQAHLTAADPRTEINVGPRLAFGNAFEGSIHGYKFEDANGNGVQDQGEGRLAGVEIVLSQVLSDGTLDEYEQTTTDENGEYWFEWLPPGVSYQVTENAPDGFGQTTADPPPIFIGSGEEWVADEFQVPHILNGVDFDWWWEIIIEPVDPIAPFGVGNQQQMFMPEGMVRLQFDPPQNLNGDSFAYVDRATGLPNEVPLEGGPWLINFELPESELVDADTMSSVAISGNGSIVVERVGNELVTVPDSNFQVDSFFDIFLELRVPGMPNGNGEPMPLRLDGESILNVPLTFPMPGDMAKPIPADDVRWMPAIFWAEGLGRELREVVDGLPGDVWDKLISVHAIPHGEPDKPVRIMREPLLAFGNRPDDDGGSIHGYKFEDLNVNGIHDVNEPRLSGVTITLEHDLDGDGVVTTEFMETDANGEYWFMDLQPGVYTVTETPPWGSFPTTPVSYTVSVGPGIELVALDGQAMLSPNSTRVEVNIGPRLAFGNAYEGSIHGFKYNDLNGNGMRDPGEMPMPGIEIVLSEVDADGTSTEISTVLTNDRGEYWFEWLEPGKSYQVSENAPAGYIQTSDDPPPLFIGSGQEWVASPQQVPHILNSVSFDWWWDIEILPQDSVPQQFMPGGMVSLEFEPPRSLDPQNPEATFDYVDLSTGRPTEIPEGSGPWLIEFNLPEAVMSDSETDSSVLIRGNGQMVVARQGDELITLPESRFQVDSFFDIFLELRVPDENGPMPLRTADEFIRIPLSFPVPETMEDAMPIAPDDVRWMPAIFWDEGMGRDLFGITQGGVLGEVWDTLVSIHAIPHGEPDKPIRIMENKSLAIGNLLSGSIHGYKFEDLNVNGKDDGEPRLRGVEITLTGDMDGDGNLDTRTQPTNGDGEYWFEGLYPGPYTVTETPPWGSFPTTPVSFDVTVESGVEYVALAGQAHLPSGDPRTEEVIGPRLAFGNAFEGSIHGYKFHDRDGNGVWDDGEQPLPGVEIILSQVTANGVVEIDRTRTDDTGQYWFEWLEPGHEYIVTENVPSGYVQTTDNPPALFISSGEEWVADENQVPHILNSVSFDWWWDIRILPEGSDEPQRLMPGGMVMLEFDPPISLNESTPDATFDFIDRETGQPGVVPEEGGPWLISFELPAAEMTDPATKSSVMVEGRGQMVVERRGDELITLPDSDFQVDSFFDIFLRLNLPDENGNSMPLAADEPRIRIPIEFPMEGAMPIGANDVRWMPAIFWAEGIGREFREILPTGELGPVWDKLISIHAVPHGEPDKPVRITDEPSLAFGNRLSSSIHGYKFEDLDANGIDNGEPRLSGVEITLTGDADGDGNVDTLTQLTNDRGEYWFEGLFPGTYTVAETPPWGSFPTTPSSYTVALGSGIELVALDGQAHLPAGDPRTEFNIGPRLAFGNAYEGSIHGYKFSDENANGQWDENEQPMAGVEIVLSRVDASGSLTEVERTETMENGEYWFEWLEPGHSYIVNEVAPDGTTQSTPDVPPLFIGSGREWVATGEQVPHILSMVDFPWWWHIEIDPVDLEDGTVTPAQTLMPEGMSILEFDPPVNLDSESPIQTFSYINTQTGYAAEVPTDGLWEISFRLPETVLRDGNLNSSARISGAGKVFVERTTVNGVDQLVTASPELTGDSFFDIFLELRVPGENGDIMNLQTTDSQSIQIPLQFPMMGSEMTIAPDDVRWMPAIFWADGLGRDFSEILSPGELGEVWDELISIHAVPHGEPDKPIRIMQDRRLAIGNAPIQEPTMTRVYVGSDHWDDQFIEHMCGDAGYGLGTCREADLGIAFDAPFDNENPPVLPFTGINEIFVRIDGLGDQQDLPPVQLFGVNQDYPAQLEPVDGNLFKLSIPEIGANSNGIDKLLLVGPGGQLRFDVLPGDSNFSRAVSVNDLGLLRLSLGTGVGDDGYEPFADFDGSAGVSVLDVRPIRMNLGLQLPPGRPGPGGPGGPPVDAVAAALDDEFGVEDASEGQATSDDSAIDVLFAKETELEHQEVTSQFSDDERWRSPHSNQKKGANADNVKLVDQAFIA